MSNQTILEVKNLKVSFDVASEGDMPWTKAKKLQAVNNISFSLNAGETLGVVGESGCGKSTLARAIVKMVPAESGEVVWLGQDLLELSNSETRPYRKQIQMIFPIGFPLGYQLLQSNSLENLHFQKHLRQNLKYTRR